MTGADAPSILRGARRAARVAAMAQLACLLEASAPKPGNVSPGCHFADARYEDFLAGAVAIGEPFAGAGTRPLGETVRLAVEASSRWTRSNTNLGIILLLAPIARAALLGSASSPLRSALRGVLRTLVLQATTIDDARSVYSAIRTAAPGGLGRTDEQDVAGEPTMTLLEVMQLARDRDGIAREYSTGFQVTFETAAPAVDKARGDGLPWEDSVVEAYLTVLAEHLDTHVIRRGGVELATKVSQLARSTLEAGGVRSTAGRQAVRDMDRALREPVHAANPGTTADIIAAAIFVVLLGGGWRAGQAGPAGPAGRAGQAEQAEQAVQGGTDATAW